MIDTRSPRFVGRLGGLLFIASGILTAATLPLPQPPGVNRQVLLIIAALAAVIGLVARFLPWERWARSRTLWLLPPAFLLVGAGNYYGSSDPYTFGIFFVVVFVWIGIGHPRGTSLWFAVPAAVTYVTPIVLRPDAIVAGASSVALAIPISLLVGESLAWIVDREKRARERAEALATAATTISSHLDEERLLGQLAEEARRALSSEHAALFQIDPETRTLREVHTAGIEEPYRALLRQLIGISFPDVPAFKTIERDHQPVVAFDTATNDIIPRELIAPFKVRSFLLLPVLAGEQLVGILGCGETSRTRRYHADDISLAQALAGQASAAMRNVLLYAQARQAARSDPLTGLGNRRAFHERLEAEIERARRHGRSLGLVLLDPDNFKDINDAWGHQAGDRVLVRLAAFLKGMTRTGDDAYRIGGDEFALVLPETSPGGAVTLAERIRRRIERSRIGAGESLRLTVSFGVSSYPDHGASPDELFERADTGLYEVKTSGGNAVGLPGPKELRGPGVRFGVDLQDVVANRRLVPYYQPIVDLDHRRTIGYECFSHLDPALGDMPTPSLLRAAGALGLLEEFDGVCRRTVLEHARDLPEDALLFLNVSPAVFIAPGFDVDILLKDLDRVGLAHDRLVIELTEQERSATSEPLTTNLLRCRTAGMRIALDDFGAGASDLDLLAALPFDYVKVDMQFLHGSQFDENRRRFHYGLRQLVAGTGAVAIAEGVEAHLDLAMVQEMGFPAAQGHLLAPPARRFESPKFPEALIAP